jgi:hypothetical protein
MLPRSGANSQHPPQVLAAIHLPFGSVSLAPDLSATHFYLFGDKNTLERRAFHRKPVSMHEAEDHSKRSQMETETRLTNQRTDLISLAVSARANYNPFSPA